MIRLLIWPVSWWRRGNECSITLPLVAKLSVEATALVWILQSQTFTQQSTNIIEIKIKSKSYDFVISNNQLNIILLNNIISFTNVKYCSVIIVSVAAVLVLCSSTYASYCPRVHRCFYKQIVTSFLDNLMNVGWLIVECWNIELLVLVRESQC